MKQQLKATVTRKHAVTQQSNAAESAYLDELTHLIHGYQKKGDNLKQMVQKLNEHDHKQADGSDWDYEAVKAVIKKLGL